MSKKRRRKIPLKDRPNVRPKMSRAEYRKFLEKHRVVDLKDYAKHRGLRGYSNKRKSALVTQIVDFKYGKKRGRKRKTPPLAEAKKAQARRSAQARNADSGQTAKKTRRPTARNVQKWKKNPRRFDLEGVDTRGEK